MKKLRKDKPTPVKVLSREFRVKQFKDTPPSQLFYNPNTTNWFRHRYSEDLIKKSIYSLFPNNCAPMLKEEEITPMSILMEWLSHYLKPENKYKDIWINPKYFFSKSVYDKILKLKEIFLQFDEDGSRKMEIDEMVTMFKTNHIDVTEDDLCSLFFKGKKFRKEDINKLYLDFYQFMQFALSKASDQDFRVFMRKIKSKILKEKAKEMQNDEDVKRKDSSCLLEKNITNDDDDLLEDDKKEPVFLPMNFNLVLDYFINKGKERKSQKKIRRAIKMMKNILKPGTYPDNDKDFLPSEGESDAASKSVSSRKSFSSDSDEDKHKKNNIENEYDKQLKEINTEQIMEEFSKLFQMSYTQSTNVSLNPKVSLQSKKKRTSKRSSTLLPTVQKLDMEEHKDAAGDNAATKRGKAKMRTQKLKNVEMKTFNENKVLLGKKVFEEDKTKRKHIENEDILFEGNENENDNDNVNEDTTEQQQQSTQQPVMLFSKMLRNKMDCKSVKELNRMHYDKYHSVQLAKIETQRYLDNYNNRIHTHTQMPKHIANSSNRKMITEINTTHLPAIADKRRTKQLVKSMFNSTMKKPNKNRFLY